MTLGGTVPKEPVRRQIVAKPLLCASHDFGWSSRTGPFLNHRGNAEAYLNQKCVKKNAPESSRPISLSPPLTLRLEDERSNRPSESRATNNPRRLDQLNRGCLLSKPNNNPKTAASLKTSRTLRWLSEKSCLRALPLIFDPLLSYRSRNGESLKLRVTISRGVLPL